jgi:hypothetical protein
MFECVLDRNLASGSKIRNTNPEIQNMVGASRATLSIDNHKHAAKAPALRVINPKRNATCKTYLPDAGPAAQRDIPHGSDHQSFERNL